MRTTNVWLIGVLYSAVVQLAVVHGFVWSPISQSPLLASTTTAASRRRNGNGGVSLPQQPQSMVASSATSDLNPSSAAAASAAASTSSSTAPLSPKEMKKKDRWQMVRKEGGIFAFPTKFGALNPFAIYYGLMAILMGIPWYLALTACQVLYFVTGNRFDRDRRIPSFLNQLWGASLMLATNSYPNIENEEILKQFYQEKRPAMFVANHNSWMDIPFMGLTVGWRNYKTVSKLELGKVPILGKAIKVCNNIMVDRSDRKSQLKTLKKGIDYLKRGIHLCTFPEGTRTKTGRLGKFKNGAFKMAYKAEAPVIPLSIVNSGKVMPVHWMFPFRSSRGYCKVVVHPPIESKGRTEEELMELVRASMISGLPEDQRPLD